MIITVTFNPIFILGVLLAAFGSILLFFAFVISYFAETANRSFWRIKLNYETDGHGDCRQMSRAGLFVGYPILLVGALLMFWGDNTFPDSWFWFIANSLFFCLIVWLVGKLLVLLMIVGKLWLNVLKEWYL